MIAISEPASKGVNQSLRPLLTVCIPTYKRGPYVEAQVRSIFAHLMQSSVSDFEVVVVNNFSPDDTASRLSGIRDDRFRLVNLTEHYDTAEENMMRALRNVRGEYVWFLGDDEVIHPPGIDFLIERLRQGNSDCLIFNSPTILNDGKLALIQPIPMQGLEISATISQIVESVGLLYTFAGFSNIVHRTSCLETEQGLAWLHSSRIYSHVGWFIESHAASSVSLFNVALVFYRQNDYSDGHWDRVAQKQGVQDLYFWSLGLVRILNRLIKLRCFTYHQAGQILELGQAGNRYKLLNDIVMKVYQQICLWQNTGDPRQAFSAEEFIEVKHFCLAADPSLFDIMSLVGHAHARLSEKDSFAIREAVFTSFSAQFHALFSEREATGQFLGRFVGRIHGFDIFRMPWRYVGVLAGDDILRESVLRVADYVPDNFSVLASNTLLAVAELAREATIARSKQARSCTGPGAAAGSTAPLTANASQPTINVTASSPPVILQTVEPRIIDALLERDREVLETTVRLQATLQSTSWKITAPLRMAARLLGRGRVRSLAT